MSYIDANGEKILPFKILPEIYIQNKIVEYSDILKKLSLNKHQLLSCLNRYKRLAPDVVDRSNAIDEEIAIMVYKACCKSNSCIFEEKIIKSIREYYRKSDDWMEDWEQKHCLLPQYLHELLSDLSLATWWIFRNEKLMKQYIKNYETT